MGQFDTTTTNIRTNSTAEDAVSDKADMRRFQARMYLKNTSLNLIITLLNSSIITFVLWGHAPHTELLIWLGLQLSIGTAALARSLYLKNKSREALQPDTIFPQAIALSTVKGLIWGALVLFVPLVPDTYQYMIIIVLVSMAAGSSVTMAAIPLSSASFIIAVTMPFSIYFLLHGQDAYTALGLMAIIFTLATLSATRAVHKMLMMQFRSEQMNTQLLEGFENAREQWIKIASLAEAFALYNREGHLLLWNQKYIDLLGALPDTVFEGARHEDILREAACPYGSEDDMHARHEWVFAQLYLHTEPDSSIIQRLSNGSWVQVISRKSDTGHLIMSYIDVSELKEIEEHSRQSELRLTRAQKLAHLGSWYWNFESGVSQWSDEMYALLGLEPQKQKAGPDLFKKHLNPQDANRFIDLMARDKSQMKSFEGRIDILSKNSTKTPVRYQVEIDFNDEGRPVGAVATFIDISYLLEAEKRIMQAQKNESIGALSRGISHDLNNLLSVIIGNADIIAEKKDMDVSSRRALEQILAMADRGDDLVNRLLASSSQQDLFPEYVPIDSFVDETISLLAHSNSPGIKLNIETKADDVCCHVDPGQLRNGLTALIFNARESMPAGGTMSITTKLITFETPPKGLLIPEGQYIEITVTDTGHGIDPRIMPRVFEPFFSTKDVGGGHGLGLSILHGFARQSGGAIRIASSVGQGTSVNLYLPVKAPVKEPRLKTIDIAPEPLSTAQSSARVLVVEDEPALLEYIHISLKSMGYTPICVSDGWKALQTLETDQNFDMLITDIVLPKGLSGWELAEKVQNINATIKVLFISGYTRMTLSNDLNIPENVELLNKPFRKKALSQAMQKILRKA